MDINFVKLTTLTQVKYWLQQGEIIAIRLDDANCYLEKKKNKLMFTIQPYVGQGKAYENNWNSLDKLFLSLKNQDMYVVKDSKLIMKKATLADKFADFIRNKIDKED